MVSEVIFVKILESAIALLIDRQEAGKMSK